MSRTAHAVTVRTPRRPRYSDTRAAALAQALADYDMPATLTAAARTVRP